MANRKILNYILGALLLAFNFKPAPTLAAQPNETKDQAGAKKKNSASVDALKQRVSCKNFNNFCDYNPVFQGNDHSSAN